MFLLSFELADFDRFADWWVESAHGLRTGTRTSISITTRLPMRHGDACCLPKCIKLAFADDVIDLSVAQLVERGTVVLIRIDIPRSLVRFRSERHAHS